MCQVVTGLAGLAFLILFFVLFCSKGPSGRPGIWHRLPAGRCIGSMKMRRAAWSGLGKRYWMRCSSMLWFRRSKRQEAGHSSNWHLAVRPTKRTCIKRMLSTYCWRVWRITAKPLGVLRGLPRKRFYTWFHHLHFGNSFIVFITASAPVQPTRLVRGEALPGYLADPIWWFLAGLIDIIM